MKLILLELTHTQFSQSLEEVLSSTIKKLNYVTTKSKQIIMNCNNYIISFLFCTAQFFILSKLVQMLTFIKLHREKDFHFLYQRYPWESFTLCLPGNFQKCTFKTKKFFGISNFKDHRQKEIFTLFHMKRDEGIFHYFSIRNM